MSGQYGWEDALEILRAMKEGQDSEETRVERCTRLVQKQKKSTSSPSHSQSILTSAVRADVDPLEKINDINPFRVKQKDRQDTNAQNHSSHPPTSNLPPHSNSSPLWLEMAVALSPPPSPPPLRRFSYILLFVVQYAAICLMV